MTSEIDAIIPIHARIPNDNTNMHLFFPPTFFPVDNSLFMYK